VRIVSSLDLSNFSLRGSSLPHCTHPLSKLIQAYEVQDAVTTFRDTLCNGILAIAAATAGNSAIAEFGRKSVGRSLGLHYRWTDR
jgi:hypothetical protein